MFPLFLYEDHLVLRNKSTHNINILSQIIFLYKGINIFATLDDFTHNRVISS